MLPLLMAMLALGLGVALVAVGLRGRRVGTVPVCQRCGFELTGIVLSAGPSPCPECGADISRHGAIRRGHRRLRRAALAVGVLGLLMGAALGAASASANAPTMNTKKPAPLLVFEARFMGREASDAALTELLRRLGTGTILGESFLPHVAGRLVDRALAEEPNLPASLAHGNAPLPTWIPALTLALESGDVSQGDRQRLARRIVPALRWPISARVPEGEMFAPTPVKPEGGSPLWELLAYAVSSEMLAMEIDGEAIELPTRPYVQVSTFGARLSGQRMGSTIARRSGPGWPSLALAPGTYTVRATHRVAIFLGTADPGAARTPDIEADVPLDAEVRVYSDPREVLTVVMPGAGVESPRIRPSSRWGGQRAARVGGATIPAVRESPWMISRVEPSGDGPPGTVDAQVMCEVFRDAGTLPTDPADYHIVARMHMDRGGELVSMALERFDDVVQLSPGQSGLRSLAMLPAIPEGLDHIEVVLAPDLDAAAARDYVSRVWGEPIRLRVELEWPDEQSDSTGGR